MRSFGKNRGPCTFFCTSSVTERVMSTSRSKRTLWSLCGSDSTRCVRKERIHTTSMERKKATGSPCGCARARPAFAQSSSTHVITAHTKERCAFPCARPCPSPASSTCRPPPPPTPILPPNLLTRPASHTCRVPGLPYQGRLRSGRRGLPYLEGLGCLLPCMWLAITECGSRVAITEFGSVSDAGDH
jgi:hypothetical protein